MTHLTPRAEWIWRQRGIDKLPFSGGSPPYEAEANRYVYFRKTVDVTGPVTAADVHVSADGRYQLYVNGQRIGRGPARSTQAFQTADPYDLTPYLRPGRNVIAALVHSYGRNTAWYELPIWEQARAFGCGGFFLQGELVTDGGVVTLDTDASWRHLVAEAWERDTPGCSLGFVEVYDARRAPQGWADVGFDDTGWEAAEVLRVPARNFAGDVVPFPALTVRDIPPLMEEMRFHQDVLSYGEVVDGPHEGDIGAQMAAEKPGFSKKPGFSLDGVTTITTSPGRGVSVVIDFGEMVTGRVGFHVDGPGGAVVDFAYGERLLDDGRVWMTAGIQGYDDTPQAHRYILREGDQRFEQFEWAGFRYLQMTFRNCDRPLHVKSVYLNFTTYPVADRGEFVCSDELLNQVWEIGANTLRLCMHDAYEDCPSREQRQWVGDAYVQLLINFAAFGDGQLATRLLRQVAQSQRPSGLTMASTPSDFGAGTFFNIPDFSLYWMMEADRYVTYTGDAVIVQELYPALVKAAAWFERFVDDDGLLANVSHWVFVDWADLDKQGQVTALNAQFVDALRAVARLALLADAPGDAVRYDRLADRITAAINRHLWDEERGVYVDTHNNGRPSRRVSQVANAMAIAFGVAPRERWPSILAYIMDEGRLVLTRTGDTDPDEVAFDVEHDVVLAQPFTMHFLHQALSMAGDHEGLLANIRYRWGKLAQAGERTWREAWQLHDYHSTCHAWSGTPTFDLSSEVLGVAPLEPGFRRFRIAPHPVDLDWASGRVPTPHGEIAVTWTVKGNRFELTVEVPPGTQATVTLPRYEGEKWKTVQVDGVENADDAPELGAGSHLIVGTIPVTLLQKPQRHREHKDFPTQWDPRGEELGG